MGPWGFLGIHNDLGRVILPKDNNARADTHAPTHTRRQAGTPTHPHTHAMAPPKKPPASEIAWEILTPPPGSPASSFFKPRTTPPPTDEFYLFAARLDGDGFILGFIRWCKNGQNMAKLVGFGLARENLSQKTQPYKISILGFASPQPS